MRSAIQPTDIFLKRIKAYMDFELKKIVVIRVKT